MVKIFKLKRENTNRLPRAAIEPHLPALFRMAYRLTGNQSDSEDLLQDTLLKLCQRPDVLKGLDAPLPWLKKILYHQFVDNYRRNRLKPANFSEVYPEGDLAEKQISSEAGPESQERNRQLQMHLLQALETLPHSQKELVILHDIEGMTLNELENILLEPLGTLKSRLHRARKSLRNELKHATF